MESENNQIKRRIYSVSELTAEIKALIEEKYPFIWISAEISNFKVPASGHYYFSLKDENAQINAVMFRGQNRNLKFLPEDGMQITGLGRLNVYEPRGTYQILFEYLEPKGVGELQIAFEQLKSRLSAEGLFDDQHKKKLPFLPQKMGIITSPTGAAVQDILNILNRRFPNLQIDILSVKVQGARAVKEIVAAFEFLNVSGNAEVIILTRGGGSLEDLAAFNSEDVARAIFASQIPVISAVGHETDFTIADFVADFRAPTPSAAAELVVPLKDDLTRKCGDLSRSLQKNLFNCIDRCRALLTAISKRLVHPKKKIQDLRLRADDFDARLIKCMINGLRQQRERLTWRIDRLYANNPLLRLKNTKEKLDQNDTNLLNYYKSYLNLKHHQLRESTLRLHALSPTAILNRGYSITRSIPGGTVIRESRNVEIGQKLEVMLSKGSLTVNVQDKNQAD